MNGLRFDHVVVCPEMEPEHYSDLRDFLLETAEDMNIPAHLTDVEEKLERWMHGHEGETVIGCLAYDEDILVGIVLLHRDHRFWHKARLRLTVKSDHRRAGLGRFLLRKILSYAQQHGIARIEADVYDVPGRDWKRYWFDAEGFEYEGTARWAARLDGRFVDVHRLAWVEIPDTH